MLLIEIEPEAQTRGVDPSVADLAQPPYSRILRQGICDPGQARRVGDAGEAVARLGECYPRRGGLPRHQLVAIEHDLRAERQMPDTLCAITNDLHGCELSHSKRADQGLSPTAARRATSLWG